MGHGCSKAPSKPKADTIQDKLPDFLNEPDDEGSVRRILLLGPSASGKTTLMKQMIQLYGPGFSEEVRLAYVPRIIYAVCSIIHELLEQGVRLRLQYPEQVKLSETYLNDAELLSTVDGTLASLSPEVVAAAKRLWAHPVTQYVLVFEPSYIRVQAQGLLPRIQEISSELYIPTFQDILFLYEPSHGITTSAALLDLRLPGERSADRGQKQARTSIMRPQFDSRSPVPGIGLPSDVHTRNNADSIATSGEPAFPVQRQLSPLHRSRRSSVASAAANAATVAAEAIARVGDSSLLAPRVDLAAPQSPKSPKRSPASPRLSSSDRHRRTSTVMRDVHGHNPKTAPTRQSISSHLTLDDGKSRKDPEPLLGSSSLELRMGFGGSRDATPLGGSGERRSTISKAPVMLIDVGGAQSERHKWLHAFKNVSAIIFVASSDDYDEVCPDDPSMTKMQASIELFTEVFHSNWTGTVPILLFLTKIDALPEKLERVPLSVSFPGYIPYAQRHAEEIVFSTEMLKQNRALVQEDEEEMRAEHKKLRGKSSRDLLGESKYARRNSRRASHAGSADFLKHEPASGRAKHLEPAEVVSQSGALLGKSVAADYESKNTDLFQGNLIRVIGGDDDVTDTEHIHHTPSTGHRSSRSQKLLGSATSSDMQGVSGDGENTELSLDDHDGSGSGDDSERSHSSMSPSSRTPETSEDDDDDDDQRDDASSIYALLTSTRDETASSASAKTFIIRPQVFQKLLAEGNLQQQHQQLLRQRLQQQQQQARLHAYKQTRNKFQGSLPEHDEEEDMEDHGDQDGEIYHSDTQERAPVGHENEDDTANSDDPGGEEDKLDPEALELATSGGLEFSPGDIQRMPPTPSSRFGEPSPSSHVQKVDQVALLGDEIDLGSTATAPDIRRKTASNHIVGPFKSAEHGVPSAAFSLFESRALHTGNAADRTKLGNDLSPSLDHQTNPSLASNLQRTLSKGSLVRKVPNAKSAFQTTNLTSFDSSGTSASKSSQVERMDTNGLDYGSSEDIHDVRELGSRNHDLEADSRSMLRQDDKLRKKLLVKELHAALVYIRERFWGKIKEESSASIARRQSCCASLLDTEQVTVVAMSLERILANSHY